MKEFEIPESISTTLYVSLEVKPDSHAFGQMRVDAFNVVDCYPDGDTYHKYLHITKMDVTIPIPPMEFNPTAVAIDYLEGQKKKELAEHHMRLKKIDDQIMELRTITYQPQENDCDIPL